MGSFHHYLAIRICNTIITEPNAYGHTGETVDPEVEFLNFEDFISGHNLDFFIDSVTHMSVIDRRKLVEFGVVKVNVFVLLQL